MGVHLQEEHRVEGGKAKMTTVLFAKKYVEAQALLICKSEEEWNGDGRKDINEELEYVFATFDAYNGGGQFDPI